MIENNEKIIEKLECILLNQYKIFIEKNNDFSNVRMSDYFQIYIGRTPPRKETQWFTKSKNGMKWASIADMGNCNVFLRNTSENLTTEAVTKFNVPIIPQNTTILSFKLTVGRIAITNEQMVSNEAIAQFQTENEEILPYLYCYLKAYNYSKLGNTSSIATATNSKSVKNMEFLLPSDYYIKLFYDNNISLLNEIREKQCINNQLTNLKKLYLKNFFN